MAEDKKQKASKKDEKFPNRLAERNSKSGEEGVKTKTPRGNKKSIPVESTDNKNNVSGVDKKHSSDIRVDDINLTEIDLELQKRTGLSSPEPESDSTETNNQGDKKFVIPQDDLGDNGGTDFENSSNQDNLLDDTTIFGTESTQKIIDPLDTPIIEREYTKPPVSENFDSGNQQEKIIPEPVVTEPINSETSSESTIPPLVDDDKNEFSSDSSSGKKESNLEDLSPSQKRKNAEKTADALLTSYAKFIPKPFKHFSSINKRKLEQMEMEDQIELNMIISDDGTRIREYVDSVNKEVESTFVITDDMKTEIRGPLIEVLMETGFALTPSQRLMIAVANQIVEMTMATFEFVKSNKYAIETFKKFHEENKAEREKAYTESEEKNQQAKNNKPSETANPPKTEAQDKSNISDVENTDQENANGDNVSMEEFLTEENGGIEVTEEPNNN